MDGLNEVSNYLKAIADPTRLTIVGLLNHHGSPLCVNAIVNQLNITQSAVSQHLRILRQADLVRTNRQGYHIHYEINRDKIDYYTELLHSILSPTITNLPDKCEDGCKEI